MTKDEWDAMEAPRKDGLILTALWKAANGKPFGIVWTTSEDGSETFYGRYIRSGKLWRTHEIDAVDVPRFTTDRNACALVLDEIELRESHDQFLRALPEEYLKYGAIGSNQADVSTRLRKMAWMYLRLAPDTICYAALKAVSDDA